MATTRLGRWAAGLFVTSLILLGHHQRADHRFESLVYPDTMGITDATVPLLNRGRNGT